MKRHIVAIKPIACVLLSAMFLMGMSCGAFSIGFTEPVGDRLADHGDGFAQGGSPAPNASADQAGDGDTIPSAVR